MFYDMDTRSSEDGMDTLKFWLDALAGVANLLTIVASLIAISVYWKNKDKISRAVQVLLDYSFQTTLTELREKLERLNEYNANEPTHVGEIKAIFYEIVGQINGNSFLVVRLAEISKKLSTYASSKQISEPKKRSLSVSCEKT